MITFRVNVEDEAGVTIRHLTAGLSGETLAGMNEVGGRSASNAATRFHREFDAQGGWRGSRSFGTGASSFGAAVARGWHYAEASASGATIANNAEHYAFKVRGGTIVPKRVKFLTIPLIAEAHGRRARDYESFTGRKLFRPRGLDVLMEKTGQGTVRGVYALKKSVTQRPWPDAIPPQEVIAAAFVDGFKKALSDHVDTL